MTLGLDFGAGSVKCIKLTHRDGGKPHLDFIGSLDINTTEPAYIDPLKGFLTQNGLMGLKTAVCLDDASLKVRKVELPKMPDADLKEAVKWKMRDVVEGPIEEFIVRSSPITEGDDAKKIDLVGYALKKETIKKMMKDLEHAGLKVEHIEPGVVSLAAATEAIHPSDNEWVATIDLGANKSVMVITGHTRFYFSRPLPGIRKTKTEDEAATFNQRLAAEIQNTIDTFSITFHVEKINRILLSGGGAYLEGCADYLTKNLAIPTEVLNPFAMVDVDAAQEETIAKSAGLFSQALALAQIQF